MPACRTRVALRRALNTSRARPRRLLEEDVVASTNIEAACAGSVRPGQNVLLGSRDDINDIAEAVGKIHTAFRAG